MRVLKASIPLAALSLACSSAEVGAASIRGSSLRNGPMDELTSEIMQAENLHRWLDVDEGNDEGAQNNNAEEGAQNDNVEEGGDAEEVEEEVEEEDAAEYDYEYGSWETEDMQYANETETSTSTIMAKVQQYEDEAVQLFETAPAQWNAGQWDLMFAVFGSILVSCCVFSAFFAYCCIFRDTGDDDVYGKKGRFRRSNKKDDVTVASEYTRDTTLLPQDDSRAFSPRSWVSGTTYFSSNDEQDRKGKKYRAPRQVTITSQDTGVSPRSNISNKSEVLEM